MKNKRPTLDYLWDVYLFHQLHEAIGGCKWWQSKSSGVVYCHQADGTSCAYPILQHYRGIYVGVRFNGRYEVFRPYCPPTEHVEPLAVTHKHIYQAVWGPFKTVRGATYMANSGRGNPLTATPSMRPSAWRSSVPTARTLRTGPMDTWSDGETSVPTADA